MQKDVGFELPERFFDGVVLDDEQWGKLLELASEVGASLSASRWLISSIAALAEETRGTKGIQQVAKVSGVSPEELKHAAVCFNAFPRPEDRFLGMRYGHHARIIELAAKMRIPIKHVLKAYYAGIIKPDSLIGGHLGGLRRKIRRYIEDDEQ